MSESRVKAIYGFYFYGFKPDSFNSNIGLSIREFIYVYETYCEKHYITVKDLLLSLHFCWKYPEGHAGASVWRFKCRQTYASKIWKPIIILSATMKEIKIENRRKSVLHITGPEEYCSLYTDSTDCMVNKPKHGDAKKYYTFKRRKFAMRYAICVSCDTGDICWVSDGDPAGSIGDITINRRGGIAEQLEFFERIGADGAYRCKRDPQYRCPHRKPRNGTLTEEQIKENNAFGARRSVVENVFARLKQFQCMTRWRHNRDLHPIVAKFVFNMLQVKQRFRPIRNLKDVPADVYEELATESWAEAEQKGKPIPLAPPKRKRGRPKGSKNKVRPRRRRRVVIDEVSSDTDSSDNDQLHNGQNNRIITDEFSAQCHGERLDSIARRTRRATKRAQL
ncbi:hypothetical protein AAMO2058_000894300 [Amorphochlora amoebiformis]